MGRSRSATILAAYLISKYNIPPHAALALIRETRPLVEPNPGFMEQLELYYDNLPGCQKNLDEVAAYQRFLYQKEVSTSTSAGLAPKVSHYNDDTGKYSVGDSASDRELRCKRCRRTLATSRSFVSHYPKEAPAAATTSRTTPLDHNPAQPSPQAQCQHHFLDPVAWMRPELEKGLLSGKLGCPKCEAKIGSYAWQGMKCSCGAWIVPAISLQKGRVDEVKSRPTQNL